MACIIINDTARTINYQTNSMVGSGYLAPGLNASFTPVASTECFVNPDAGYQLNVQSNTQYNLVGIKFRYSVSQSIAAEWVVFILNNSNQKTMASALKNSLNIPINLSSGQNSVQLLNPGEIADLTDGQVYYIYIVGWPPSSFKVDNYRSYSIDDLSAQFTETPIS